MFIYVSNVYIPARSVMFISGIQLSFGVSMSCVMQWSSYTESRVLGYGHGSNRVGVGLSLDYMLGYLDYGQV